MIHQPNSLQGKAVENRRELNYETTYVFLYTGHMSNGCYYNLIFLRWCSAREWVGLAAYCALLVRKN